MKLTTAILSLPHSGAAIERTFSQFKLIKNKRRTNLSNETFESLLFIKINKMDISSSMNFLNLIILSVKNIKRTVISQSETSKEIMENSTTIYNFVLFQSQYVKKTKLNKNSSFSNEVLPEDKFKNLQLNSVAKSEISVEYKIKEQKVETNIDPYSK